MEFQHRVREDRILSQLTSQAADIDLILEPVYKEFQQFLLSIEGLVPEDFETKLNITQIVQSIALRLNKAIECTTCGEPSNLRWTMGGNAKSGVFSFNLREQTTADVLLFLILNSCQNHPERNMRKRN